MKYTWTCQKCKKSVVVHRSMSEYNTPPDDTEAVCECREYKRHHCEGVEARFTTGRQKGKYNSLSD